MTYAPGVHNLAEVEIASQRAETNVIRRNLREFPRPPSGPKPPPSWEVKSAVNYGSENAAALLMDDFEWRKRSLMLMLDESILADREAGQSATNLNHVPSLQTLCLRIIVLEDLPSRWPIHFVLSLPAHIRQRIGLEAAIWNPLSSRVLNAIYSPRDVHRIIIVGKPLAPVPIAPSREIYKVPSLQGINQEHLEDLLQNLLGLHANTSKDNDVDDEPDSWDDGAHSSSSASEFGVSSSSDSQSLVPLTSLCLIHLSLPESITPTLPHTLTRLSLINMTSTTMSLPSESQVPLRTLSRNLPRLTHLDISYNKLDRNRTVSIAWDTQWKEMEVIGMRRCAWWVGHVKQSLSIEAICEIGQLINARRPGRWIDFVFE